MGRGAAVSEADHEVRAREFVDSILEINRHHGVDESAAEIEYEAAVDSAARTFMSLRKQAAEDSGDMNGELPGARE
jgi:hypothetical protein